MNDDYYPRKPMPLERCQHIMCKGMEVYGDDYQTPEDEDHRSNDFWCMKTQTVIGPDGKSVALTICDPNRNCHEAL